MFLYLPTKIIVLFVLCGVWIFGLETMFGTVVVVTLD